MVVEKIRSNTTTDEQDERRLGIDRRKFVYDDHYPERRTRGERRQQKMTARERYELRKKQKERALN